MNWHAAAVHLPLVLVLVWPVVDLVGLALRRPAISWTAVGLLVVAIVSSLVATATGQAEYDQAIAKGFAQEVLDTHAELAGTVPWALLAVGAARLWLPSRIGRSGHLLGTVAGLALSVLLLRVGHTGGVLVYEYGVGVQSIEDRPR